MPSEIRRSISPGKTHSPCRARFFTLSKRKGLPHLFRLKTARSTISCTREDRTKAHRRRGGFGAVGLNYSASRPPENAAKLLLGVAFGGEGSARSQSGYMHNSFGPACAPDP